MFFYDNFQHILGDPFYSKKSINLGFLMDFLEVIDELLFDLCMIFHSFPSWLLNERDCIVHSSLNCYYVEVFGVPFSFFQQSNPGFMLS